MQALSFARMLFHGPAIVFMDEATSSLDVSLESRLLKDCCNRGISMISVCHRDSALGYHHRMLRYTSQYTGSKELHDPTSWIVSPVPLDDLKLQQNERRLRNPSSNGSESQNQFVTRQKKILLSYANASLKVVGQHLNLSCRSVSNPGKACQHAACMQCWFQMDA